MIMRRGRLAIAFCLAVTALVGSVCVSTASAVKFAPAGANVNATVSNLQLNSSLITFTCTLGQTGTVGAASSTITLNNPAGGFGVCTVGGAMKAIYPGLTAKIYPSASWTASAVSTTRVNLSYPATFANGIDLLVYNNGSMFCSQRFDTNTTLGSAGNWSNATSKAALSPGTMHFTTLFASCTGEQSGVYSVAGGHLILANATNPAVPITVQP